MHLYENKKYNANVHNKFKFDLNVRNVPQYETSDQ